MHSAGLELTKLTYTRLEDNVIRHRGDRSITLPHDDFAQKFDRYIPVAAARVGRRGGASPSKRRLEP